MASLRIEEKSISNLAGKTAIITGGSSGIGLSTAKILAGKGAVVYILDIHEPDNESILAGPELIRFRKCDVSSWAELRDIFEEVQKFDYVFANAGIVEEKCNYFADTFDADSKLQEPTYRELDVNLRAVINTVKLGWSFMRKHKIAGSIVITTSATAYAPEQVLPVYAGTKLALVGMIRALRSVMIKDGITINGVAPAATQTKLLPADLAASIRALDLPVSNADFVGLALVYSATARQARRVEVYGKEAETDLWADERWNGRVIFTLGDRYTELEEPISDLRRFWLGEENLELTRRQQAATDVRCVERGQGAT